MATVWMVLIALALAIWSAWWVVSTAAKVADDTANAIQDWYARAATVLFGKRNDPSAVLVEPPNLRNQFG